MVALFYESPGLKSWLKYLSWTRLSRFGFYMPGRKVVALAPFLIHAGIVLYCWDREFVGDEVGSES